MRDGDLVIVAIHEVQDARLGVVARNFDTARGIDAGEMIAQTLQRFVAVATGFGNHTCGVTVASAVLCWGLGSEGQLGDGYTRDRQSLPVGVLAPSP